jgi:hypothetical protein
MHKKGGCKYLKAMFIKFNILFPLDAAFEQCRDGFKSEVSQTPRSQILSVDTIGQSSAKKTGKRGLDAPKY